MNFCNKCGVKTNPNYQYCLNCGNYFEARNENVSNAKNLSLFACFLKCIKEPFNINGRACIKEYWGFMLFSSLIYALLSFTLMQTDYMSFIRWIFCFFSFAITVRRLHDINKSWHIALLMLLLGLICSIGLYSNTFYYYLMYFDYRFNYYEITWFLGIFSLLINPYLMITLFFLGLLTKKGDKGTNKYGPDPLE